MAMVLGHEIGHVIEEHALESLRRRRSGQRPIVAVLSSSRPALSLWVAPRRHATRAHTRGTRAGWPRARRVRRWLWIEGAEWKVYPSRAGGDIARGRPVGGPGDQAGLPRCADAGRSRAAVGAVARPRGSDPHSRPAPGSRTHRGRTPSRTPPRGTAPCATARLWRSRLAAAAATPAPGEEATWRDGGNRPTGMGGRRRAARGAAITRTRSPTPA